MWIRERFFDISKRREARRIRVGPALVSTAFTVMMVGCVVTDQIEFSDRVNMPVAIVAYLPANDATIPAFRETDITFEATVWDPDLDDLNDPKIRGKLVIHSDFMSGSVSEMCRNPVDEVSELGDVYFTLKCPYTVPNEAGLEGHDLTVELVVSDRGFDRDENPKMGAEVSRVTWTIQVEGE